VCSKSRKGRLRSPLSLVVADLRLGVRALALATLEQLDVGVDVVGQHGLQAMAVMIAKRQLRAGVRALAAHDHPRSGRPRRQIEVRGDLGDLAVLTLAAIGSERGDPRALGGALRSRP
jgi:hypothetical protein